MGRGKTKPWTAAFRHIRMVNWPERIYPPKSTAADLDAAEAKLNFHFPASYRAFAEEFGLGGTLHVLPDVLPLTRPLGVKGDHWSSVVDATRFFRSYDWEADRRGSPATLLNRVVVFAVDGGYHTFVFDPLEVTNARLPEYRIYDVDRQNKAVAIAASFGEWLSWIDGHYRGEPEEEETEPEFPPVFKPDSHERNPLLYSRHGLPRWNKAPGKRSTQLWLQWNNNTVRGLALSIGDEGRADTFPILADALEEAGCKNADLLRSCRDGDPDIDGAWVLQVLLGKHTT